MDVARPVVGQSPIICFVAGSKYRRVFLNDDVHSDNVSFWQSWSAVVYSKTLKIERTIKWLTRKLIISLNKLLFYLIWVSACLCTLYVLTALAHCLLPSIIGWTGHPVKGELSDNTSNSSYDLFIEVIMFHVPIFYFLYQCTPQTRRRLLRRNIWIRRAQVATSAYQLLNHSLSNNILYWSLWFNQRALTAEALHSNMQWKHLESIKGAESIAYFFSWSHPFVPYPLWSRRPQHSHTKPYLPRLKYPYIHFTMVNLTVSAFTVTLLAGSAIAAPTFYEESDIQQRSPGRFGGLALSVSSRYY